MNFILDNHLSYRIAAALHQLAEKDGDIVRHLSEEFGEARRGSSSAPDAVWIQALADRQEDWVVVTGDYRIRTRPQEQQVFQDARLTTFFLAKGWTNIGYWRTAELLVAWWPRIREQSALASAGMIWEVPCSRSGRFKPPKR